MKNDEIKDGLEELTDEQLEKVLGGLEEAFERKVADNGNAMQITGKTVGLDSQVSAICFGVADKNGEQNRTASSININSLTE